MGAHMLRSLKRKPCCLNMFREDPRTSRVFLVKEKEIARRSVIGAPHRGGTWPPTGSHQATLRMRGKLTRIRLFSGWKKGVAEATPWEGSFELSFMKHNPSFDSQSHKSSNGKWLCISKEIDNHFAVFTFVNHSL